MPLMMMIPHIRCRHAYATLLISLITPSLRRYGDAASADDAVDAA